jgi:HAD superfamily hydrolase (TIGR01509 family)
MLKPPHIVIFDLGKVLVDFDFAIAARKIAANGDRPPAEVQKIIDGSPLLSRYETGEIDKAEFYRQVCKQTGYRGTQEEFEPAFSEIFTAIEPMIAAHSELRRLHVPTFILSNTNDLAATHIRRKFPFFSNFDGYILSYEQGVMKPHDRIYEIAENLTGCRGSQIAYIDDRPENVEPAKLRGWNVVHHQTPGETIAALRKMGVLP